ncbi:conserved hypothetical protein [Culex quinquefasciatus]|uniref:Osiris n=1 Tax=Culex quinquefasciatus TaxID=7176 RepID=B0WLW5_CULQU|nr:conserved hypothetical protein [Culex quinquefasciatus]|eukprot:XP_001849699.1 conserved hypothetical protein [Culex quinquefasciatus]
MKQSVAVHAVVIFLVGVVFIGGVQAAFKDIGGCARLDSAWSCYGGRILRNVVKQFAAEKSLELMPGVEIVQVDRSGEERNRELNEVDDRDDGSVTGSVTRYLTNHELKVNLGEMVRKKARKKDKGGYGAIMMMGMMMSKVLGALGFGGVALLAMKALGVSMMALLLSAILGLKKLTESGGDHKGRHNTEFRVSSGGDDPLAMVAATETDGTGYGIEHYQEATTDGGAGRRRRSPQDHDQQLAYHGWAAVVG